MQYCTTCGAPLDGAAFCTQCGASSDTAPAGDMTQPRSVPAALPPPEVRSRPGWATPPSPQEAGPPAVPPNPWKPPAAPQRYLPLVVGVIAGLVLLGAGVTGGVLLMKKHSDQPAATLSPVAVGSAPATAGSTPAGPSSATAPSTAPPVGPDAAMPEQVARDIDGLLRQEVQGHRSFSAAVSALDRSADACSDQGPTQPRIDAIASFRSLRTRLRQQLAGLPDSDDAELDRLRHDLLSIWRELAPADARFLSSAQQPCPRGTKPTTSTESQSRRRAWRSRWQRLLAAHPAWKFDEGDLLAGSPPPL